MDGSESAHIAPAPRQRGPIGRRLAVVGAVWIALAGAAVGFAWLLDEQPARPRASVAPQGLPLLRLYLNRDLPAEVLNRPDLASQVQKLEDLAESTDSPARWVELGTAAQRIGDLESADFSFSRALALDPGRVEARVGKAMVEGATGPEGLTRAAKALAELARTNSTNQLVAFNEAIVSVYRADRDGATRGFARAEALAPRTPLGVLARRFRGAAGGPTGSP